MGGRQEGEGREEGEEKGEMMEEMMIRTQVIGTSYLKNKFSEIVAERRCGIDRKPGRELICSFFKTHLTSLS